MSIAVRVVQLRARPVARNDLQKDEHRPYAEHWHS
jgi:hypothetical protein